MSTTVPEGGGAGVTSEPFGTVANPDSPSNGWTSNCTRSERRGMEVKIMTYGGILQSIKVPDRDGPMANVTLGFDNLDHYVNQNPYFGGITGRYANRIANGQFTLDGEKYQLATNNGPNTCTAGTRVRQAGLDGRGDPRRRRVGLGSPTPAPTARRATPARSTSR